MNMLHLSALILALTAGNPPNPVAQHHYLLGTWDCTYTVGARKGTYTTVWSQILGGQWLQQTIDQPPKTRDVFLTGYDRARGAWVRFGALNDGEYFAMRMKDQADGGWRWTYVSFFKGYRTGTDARLRRISDTRYAIDGPTYPYAGTLITEHHICSKR